MKMALPPRSALLFAFMLTISPCLALESVDYFTLVLMWPGAYCQQTNGGCCRPTTTGEPAGDFLIKDLVPYSSNGKPITNCRKENFDYNQISNLAHDLGAYWANIRCPSNNGRSSWKSKWKQYGVCSGLNETDYFNTGLNLLQKADISYDLAKRDISPDYNLYPVADIQSAIAEGIGAEPLIRCSKGPFDKFQLFEVHICIDGGGAAIIECPVKPKFTCGDEILFHPYRSWMLKSSGAFGDGSNIQLPVGME